MRIRRLAAAGAGLVLGTLVTGLVVLDARQAPAAPQTPAPAAQQPGRPATPDGVFRSAVDLVTTDVIARDARDLFIADLTKDEIEIFEDGVKQELASMTLVHGGRVLNLQAPPPPPAQEGIILPTARPRNDAAGRIFLILVDDLHLDFRNTGRIRDLFKRISRTLVHEGDMFGIVSTGPSSLAIDLTYDRKILDEAIKKITGNGLKPSDIIQGQDGPQGPTEVRYRAQVAFSTARDIVTQLERITNRRKAVVWVSNGFDFNPFENQRQGEDPIYGGRMGQTREEGQEINRTMNQGQQFSDADLARELADLTRSANRANATFYTIDPRGLVAGAGSRRDGRSHRLPEPHPQDAGQPARAGDGNRRHRHRQPEQLREGLEADRRRDQRLLRGGLLLEQPRPAEAHAENRGQGEARGAQRVVAHVVHAASADAADQVARAARRGRPEVAAGRVMLGAAEPLRCVGAAGARGLDRLEDPRLQPGHGLRLHLRECTPHVVAEIDADDAVGTR